MTRLIFSTQNSQMRSYYILLRSLSPSHGILTSGSQLTALSTDRRITAALCLALPARFACPRNSAVVPWRNARALSWNCHFCICGIGCGICPRRGLARRDRRRVRRCERFGARHNTLARRVLRRLIHRHAWGVRCSQKECRARGTYCNRGQGIGE